MRPLREALAGAGYGDVRTHLQSGNVVLASRKAPQRLARDLEREIEAAFGVTTRVIVRTRDELADVVARDPFGKLATNGSRFHVSFLDGELDAAIARDLEAADVAPERVVVSGREIYRWHPGGTQRSALARLLGDDRLGVVSTVRTWNVVTRLLSLADE